MTDRDNQQSNAGESVGLYQKYEVLKDGEPQQGCFVLKPESDTAARRALIRYAEATDDEKLTDDLLQWVADIESGDTP